MTIQTATDTLHKTTHNSVRELFGSFGHLNFDRNVFAMLTGYIDDSANTNQSIVTLGCLIADGSHWEQFEREWKNLLDQTNKALKAAGKPEISRYHATDCSTMHNEFREWDIPMTREITAEIKKIFARHPVVTIAYGAVISDVAEIFPEAGEKVYNLAFSIFLIHIMRYVRDKVLLDIRWPEEFLSMIQERNEYSGILLNTFENERTDAKYLNKFASITSMDWKTAILLQPADFTAYESFKAIEGKLSNRPRRKSLELLLDLESVGGRCVKLEKLGFQEFRDSLGIEGVNTLFKNARIHPNEKTS